MLVIFDCDGVLVDSETLAADVFSRELALVGIKLSAEACYRQFKGHTLPICFEWLQSTFGCTLPDGFADTIRTATRVAFSQGLSPVEGVESVLAQLQGRAIPFCVASNGQLGKIHHSLSVTGLLPYFEGRCFSAESVARGKPAPDLFLMAAKAFGEPPAACVVVEDSSVGIAAASAAGMFPIFFGSESPPDGVKAAVANMGDLQSLLDRLATD